MNRQCERCKVVTMIDSFHRICFDCFCELDLKAVEEEEFLRFLEEDAESSLGEETFLRLVKEEEE